MDGGEPWMAVNPATNSPYPDRDFNTLAFYPAFVFGPRTWPVGWPSTAT